MSIDNEIMQLSKKKKNNPVIKFLESGYSEDWYFKVHRAFEKSMGITMGKEKKIQSPVISFQKGDTFHNSLLAYSDWLSYLKDNPITLQVEFSSSSGREENNFNFGYVRFEVYKPNNDKTKLEKQSVEECNIFEFLTILKKGLIENG